jgi:hypothetical protein
MLIRSWVVGGLILVGGGRAWAADAAPKEEAKRAFSAGVILLKDPDGAKYEEALAQFDKAYRLSGSWKVLGNIGLCSLKLERDGEAISAYQKYLAEGGKEIDAEERAQVERDLAALKEQVVHVRIDLPAGASRLVDERTSAQGGHIINEYALATTVAELGLHPGHHYISVRLPSGEAKWEVNLDPSAAVSHKFEATSGPHPTERAQPEARRSPALGYVIGAAGVVGIGIGSFFGLKTFSNKQDSDAYCVGTSCEQKGLDLRSDAKTFATISDVAFAAGVAGVAVGAYLVFFGGSAGRPGSGVALGSSVAAGRAGLELRGDW